MLPAELVRQIRLLEIRTDRALLTVRITSINGHS